MSGRQLLQLYTYLETSCSARPLGFFISIVGLSSGYWEIVNEYSNFNVQLARTYT